MTTKGAALPPGEPAAEVDIDVALVQHLLKSQHPDLADRSLQLVANGWDNCSFRLGADLTVRLPRRAVAAQLILNEQRWLPEISSRLSVAIPAPVRVGQPGDRYPWGWSVVPWFEGRVAAEQPLAESQASLFGRFLAELHQPALGQAPPNPFRGVPLSARHESFETRLASVSDQRGWAAVEDLDLDRLRELFELALKAPPAKEDLWLHGDLHPKNVIVSATSELVAVIDWGDLTSGDQATDLAAVWMQFPCSVHGQCFAAYGRADPGCRARALGWAILFGLILLDSGLAGDKAFVQVGRTTLKRACQA